MEPAARQFRLDFIPLSRERYVFICGLAATERPDVVALLEHLKSDRFRRMVAELPGYSTPQVGEVVRLEEAMPELPDRRSKVERVCVKH